MLSPVYSIAEVFYSLQGEGVNTGLPMVFVRFAGCNLSCPWCDTDHTEKARLTLDELVTVILQEDENDSKRVLFTGGEPTMQIDHSLMYALRTHGYWMGLETNGTRPILSMHIPNPHSQVKLDWITVSPKRGAPPLAAGSRPYHELRLPVDEHTSSECIREAEKVRATHYVLSPIFAGTDMIGANVSAAIRLAKENPKWRLSVQTHKQLGFA